jgi:hypothetical protein
LRIELAELQTTLAELQQTMAADGANMVIDMPAFLNECSPCCCGSSTCDEG